MTPCGGSMRLSSRTVCREGTEDSTLTAGGRVPVAAVVAAAMVAVVVMAAGIDVDSEVRGLFSERVTMDSSSRSSSTRSNRIVSNIEVVRVLRPHRVGGS